MPISQKETNIEKFEGSVSKEEGGFTTFINASLRSIPDGFAAGIYAYLLSLPRDWELNPKQLANYYHCDKKTIYKALTLLSNIGLLTREDLREKGRFVKFHYVVHLHKKDISKPTKPQLDKGFSPVPVLSEMVKPEMVKRNTYKRNNIQNKEYKKTTTTKETEKSKSSSSFVISKEIDSKLLSIRDKYLQADELERTDEEFLRQCSHHLDNGDKNKYNLTRRIKGLESIIKKGFFEKPAGYDEKKVIKSIFTPEETALIQTYQHAVRMVSLGAKLKDYMPDQTEVKKAIKLMEKVDSNKEPIEKRHGLIGFSSI